MNEEQKKYLERLSTIKTPKWKKGQANDTYDDVCWTYSQIRNLAKDILEGVEDFEDKKLILENLVKKTEELDKEIFLLKEENKK